MSVIQLHECKPYVEIVQSLRSLADRIESGEHGHVTTVAVCLGHQTAERGTGDGMEKSELTCDLFGYGPRSDILTIRGLLLTCATQI